MKKKWEKQFKLCPDEVNLDSGIKIPVMLNFFQDTAIEHANHLRIGYTDLLKNNHAWVLSHLYIQVFAPAVKTHELKVRTWPSGIKKKYVLRDFEIVSANDESLIAAGTSRWIVIDFKKRAFYRGNNYLDIATNASLENKYLHSFDKLPKISDTVIEKTFSVEFGDIDINRHVNNVTYVKWLTEFTSHKFLSDRKMKSIEIQFLSEAVYKDNIDSHSVPRDTNEFIHSLYNKTSNKECIRAKTIWFD